MSMINATTLAILLLIVVTIVYELWLKKEEEKPTHQIISIARTSLYYKDRKRLAGEKVRVIKVLGAKGPWMDCLLEDEKGEQILIYGVRMRKLS